MGRLKGGHFFWQPLGETCDEGGYTREYVEIQCTCVRASVFQEEKGENKQTLGMERLELESCSGFDTSYISEYVYAHTLALALAHK